MVYVIFSLSLSVCLSVSLSLSVSLCTSLFSVLNFCAVFLPAVADLRIEFFIEIFKTFPPPPPPPIGLHAAVRFFSKINSVIFRVKFPEPARNFPLRANIGSGGKKKKPHG